MRHTFATWSLAAGMSIFALSRRMGTSVQMIDLTYGHLARDADDYDRGLLDAYDAAEASNGHVVGTDPAGIARGRGCRRMRKDAAVRGHLGGVGGPGLEPGTSCL